MADVQSKLKNIMDNLYTVEQVAKKLKVSKITVYRFIKKGKIRASKIGKEYRVKESNLEDFLKKTET